MALKRRDREGARGAVPSMMCHLLFLTLGMVEFGFQNADKRQIAVDLAVIEAIADDELIRHLETYVVEGDIYHSSGPLIQEGTDFEAGWVPGAKVVSYVVEGAPGIYDIFND